MFDLLERYFIIRDTIRAYQDGTLLYYIGALLILTILGFVVRRVFGTRRLQKVADYCLYAFFILWGGLCIYIGVIALKAGGSYYEGGVPLILFLGIVLVLAPFYWSFLRRFFGKIFSLIDIKGGKKDRED